MHVALILCKKANNLQTLPLTVAANGNRPAADFSKPPELLQRPVAHNKNESNLICGKKKERKCP